MCLITLAWQAHPDYALIVAANRDELHTRPTVPAGPWHDQPRIFAGRDLQDGGTWMGVTTTGRFAALTNFRGPAPHKPSARSRGHLVADFLAGATSAEGYAREQAPRSMEYNGFNLLLGDDQGLWYLADDGDGLVSVARGVHALSNARLDTPWPKSTGLAEVLRGLIDRQAAEDALAEQLFEALGDTRPASDGALPETGVGVARERELSPRKIIAPRYGTRSSAVVLMAHDRTIRFEERSFDALGRVSGAVQRRLRPSIDPPA